MGLYDSFYAGLTCPNCECQASVEAQTKDFENAMLTYSVGESVEPLTHADLRGLTGCRWCDASVEVPILVREGRFIGFGEPALMSPLSDGEFPKMSVEAEALYLQVKASCGTGTDVGSWRMVSAA